MEASIMARAHVVQNRGPTGTRPVETGLPESLRD